jgi:hypothetical protein
MDRHVDFFGRRAFLALSTASLLGSRTFGDEAASPKQAKDAGQRPRAPKLADTWVQIAPSPKLPELPSDPGQVVDHCVFRAASGKWQLWMQIRGTAVGRVFYRLEGGETLEQPDWTHHGICWRADRNAGESWNTGDQEWIHAPYVMREGKQFILYYGGGPSKQGGAQICVATSTDGITFQRLKNEKGLTEVCSGPGFGRDPMVLRIGDEYVMYYAADRNNGGVIVARTSPRPFGAPWSDYRIVSEKGVCGTDRTSQQCPYVVHRDGIYYLFKMGPSNRYETAVYYSGDPFDFGKEDDQLLCVLKSSASEVIEADGRFYLSSLIPGYKGVRIRRLEW